MRNQDLIDLLLKVTREQQNKIDVRDDELVDKLKLVNETVSLSDSIISITKTAHPVKWGEPLWSLFTWGNGVLSYVIAAAVIDFITTIRATQYNSLMAEVKAAIEGIPTHDVDIAYSYNDDNTIYRVTITDNSPAGDAGYDITCVGTYQYTGSRVDYIDWQFATGEMNIITTETFTWVGNNATAINRNILILSASGFGDGFSKVQFG